MEFPDGQGEGCFKGLVDEAVVYRRALTQCELKEVMWSQRIVTTKKVYPARSAERNFGTKDIVFNLKFNNVSGYAVADESGKGTLTMIAFLVNIITNAHLSKTAKAAPQSHPC